MSAWQVGMNAFMQGDKLTSLLQQSSLTAHPPDMLTAPQQATTTDIPMNLSWNERRKLNRYLKKDNKAEATRVKEQEEELRRQEKAFTKEWKKSEKFGTSFDLSPYSILMGLKHRAQAKGYKKLKKEAKHQSKQSQTPAHQPTRPLPHPFPTNTNSFTTYYLPVNGPLGAVDYPAPMLPSLAAFGVADTGMGRGGHGTVMSRCVP